MKSVIKELISYQNFPVITVVTSLGLTVHENETKVRRALGYAFDLTPKRLLKVDRDIFFARLELMLAEMSAVEHPKGVTVFVGKDLVRILPLNYAAEDRIVIDRACALSEVVYSATMFPCFNVIVLSSKGAQVYRTSGEHLVEVKSCQLVDYVSRLIESRVDASKAVQSVDGNNEKAGGCYVHKLHHAFLALLKNLDFPAIVIGSDRIGPLCPEMTKYISGVAEGDFDFVSTAEIGRLATEIADEWVKSKMQHGIAAIENFRRYKKLASAADEVTTLIEDGCVEKVYFEGLPATAVTECDSHKRTLMDKIVSSALKKGAEVLFLPAKSLSEYSGMVAGLRY